MHSYTPTDDVSNRVQAAFDYLMKFKGKASEFFPYSYTPDLKKIAKHWGESYYS